MDQTASDPDGLGTSERRRLQRWVAAVGLLTAAEDQAAADVPETNALGLLAAEAACEAMLGLIVGTLEAREVRGREPGFPQVLEEARRADTTLPAALAADLMVTHRARNGFVHAGQVVHHHELERAIEAAHALSERVPLAGQRPLHGLASLVADLIQVEAVGLWLRRYDEMSGAGRWDVAADHLARALDNAIERTVPPIRGHRRDILSVTGDMARIAQGLGIDRDRRAVNEALDGLAAWVLPVALGISPARLAFVRSIVGTQRDEDRSGHAQSVDRPSRPRLASDIRRAAGIVVQVLLRLSMMGSLAPRRYDGQLIELWREDLVQIDRRSDGSP